MFYILQLILSAIQMNVTAIAETCKRSSKVVLHILRGILLPVRLLQQLVMPGLRFESPGGADQEGQLVVRRRSIELLDCLLHNAEELLRHLGGDGEAGKGGFKAVLLKELRFLLRSERLPSVELLLSLWRAETTEFSPPQVAAHLLRITRFLAATVMPQASSELNVTALMADIEQLQAGGLDSEAVEALHLEALLLLTDLIKKSEVRQEEEEEDNEDQEEAKESRQITKATGPTASSFLLLQSSLTEDTFRILLGTIFSAEPLTSSRSAAMRKREEASREILRVVMRQSRASLPEGGIDLQLVLALCCPAPPPRLVAQLAQAMLR